jgi:hypothetical protein
VHFTGSTTTQRRGQYPRSLQNSAQSSRLIATLHQLNTDGLADDGDVCDSDDDEDGCLDGEDDKPKNAWMLVWVAAATSSS